jgi:protein-L-isoaspartate O-methyltransferase
MLKHCMKKVGLDIKAVKTDTWLNYVKMTQFDRIFLHGKIAE